MVSNSKVKDVHCLLKSIGSFSGGQATVVDFDSDNIEHFTVQIKPDDGIYKGGSFNFSFNLGNYPEDHPSVTCTTKIYHPNIDSYEDCDNICLNILDSDWESERSLEDVVQGLLFLFYEPNLDDPLSTLFEPGMDHDEFKDNVRRSLFGGDVEGEEFPRNLDEAENGNLSEEPGGGNDIHGMVRGLLEDILTETLSSKAEQDETTLFSEVEQEETSESVIVEQGQADVSPFVSLSVQVEQGETALPVKLEQEEITLTGKVEQAEIITQTMDNPANKPVLSLEVNSSGEAVSIENKTLNANEDTFQDNEVFPPSFTRELSKSEPRKGTDEETNIMKILENDTKICTEKGCGTLNTIYNTRPRNNSFCRTSCFMDNLIPGVATIAVLISNAVGGLFHNAEKES